MKLCSYAGWAVVRTLYASFYSIRSIYFERVKRAQDGSGMHVHVQEGSGSVGGLGRL